MSWENVGDTPSPENIMMHDVRPEVAIRLPSTVRIAQIPCEIMTRRIQKKSGVMKSVKFVDCLRTTLRYKKPQRPRQQAVMQGHRDDARRELRTRP